MGINSIVFLLNKNNFQITMKILNTIFNIKQNTFAENFIFLFLIKEKTINKILFIFEQYP